MFLSAKLDLDAIFKLTLMWLFPEDVFFCEQQWLRRN
jgi:hypothetical protein